MSQVPKHQGSGREEEILDPVGEISKATKQTQLAERSKTLNNLSVTPYSNGFWNSEEFLEALQEALLQKFSDAKFNDLKYKPQATRPGSHWGTIEQKIEPISDVVLMAYGHCGSCTTNTIKDVVDLERRGVPSIAYVTEEFYSLAVYDACHLGAPGLAVIPIEHPVAQIPAEEVPERITEELVADTVFALTSPADEVAAEFESRYDLDDYSGRPEYDRCTL